MADHPHAARYREVSESLAAGDLGRIEELLAEDVVWWEIGSSTPVRGRAALLERMQSMGDTEIKAEIHDVLANDEHLIALLNATATRNGESFRYRTAEIHHVNAAGQVTERWAFSDDTEAIIDFFS